MLKLSEQRLWDDNEPEAVLSRHVRDLGFPTYSDEDGLDKFEAVELEIDSVLLSIRTYAGDPANTSSIYFAHDPRGPGQRPIKIYAALTDKILSDLSLTEADVVWRRSTAD